METESKSRIDEIMQDHDRVLRALGQGIRQAIRESKLLGYPISVWDYENQRVKWIQPEDIELDDKA